MNAIKLKMNVTDTRANLAYHGTRFQRFQPLIHAYVSAIQLKMIGSPGSLVISDAYHQNKINIPGTLFEMKE